MGNYTRILTDDGIIGMIQIFLFTGLRRGELCGLKFEDIFSHASILQKLHKN